MTDPVLRALHEACADLRALGVGYAVIGGIAISVTAQIRTTRDVDLVAAVDDDAAAERLTRGLVGRRYALAQVLEQTAVGQLSMVRIRSNTAAQIVVDLLFASSGIEREVVNEAEQVDVGGAVVPVASAAHLIALKVLSRSDRRPQDDQDLVALLTGASNDTVTARVATRASSARCGAP
jgi:predicted nucleotidyltransferase